MLDTNLDNNINFMITADELNQQIENNDKLILVDVRERVDYEPCPMRNESEAMSYFQ
jgi:rhodanese-related sulfurtransferase